MYNWLKIKYNYKILFNIYYKIQINDVQKKYYCIFN